MDSYTTEEDDHVQVCAEEGGEVMEFPKEENNTVLVSTLQAQHPAAIGLKYRGASGAWRALRAEDNVLDAPKGGWGDRVYCLTVGETIKRKALESHDVDTKRSRLNPLLQDMAVMNLPFQTTEDELRQYFEKSYGELDYCEVKLFRDTGKSRGYGFIRFKDEVVAKEASTAEHYLLGRKVDVKLKQGKPMKLFVGRLPDGTNTQQLTEYFETFGELQDVYIPKPFRNFAFITYATTEDGKQVLAESHALNGVRLNVMERNQDPKAKDQHNDNNSRSSNYSSPSTNYSSSSYNSTNTASNQGGASNYSSPSYGNYYGSKSTQEPRAPPPPAPSVSYPNNNNRYSTTMTSDTAYNNAYSTTNQRPAATGTGTGTMDKDLKNMLLQYLSAQ